MLSQERNKTTWLNIINKEESRDRRSCHELLILMPVFFCFVINLFLITKKWGEL